MYLVKTPWWLKKIYPSFIWNRKDAGKTIYLTFDDGPHETITPFVLDLLKNYEAKATFFCIGKNVQAHPSIYNRIIREGHAVGNHTFNHLNGWQTVDATYINNIKQAATLISSNLFRPPYGRIKKSQAKELSKRQEGNSKLEEASNRNATHHPVLPTPHSPFTIIMWDVLSGDFDTTLSPDKCLANVLRYTTNGSIIVFHDSTKAWDRMSYALPKVLEHFGKLGFAFESLPQG
jgi:peptidoglycan/xylan/chitin deacetylase (PgdA/CDA1 family)